MWLLIGLLKRVQLFCLSFALAGAAMMFAGISSGTLERGEVYLDLSERFAVILVNNFPEFASQFAPEDATALEAQREQQASYQPAQPAIRSANAPDSSLRALQMRQLTVPAE